MANATKKFGKAGLAVLAASVLGLSGCGGGADTEEAFVGLPSDPVDQELALLALSKDMDGDPTDGGTFPSPTDPLVQLGMRLFFSKSLSIDQDSACVTCHHPLLGGGDGLSLPIGVEPVVEDLLGPGRLHRNTGTNFDGGPTVPRHSPTTFNVGLRKQVLLFDGRVESLMQPTGAVPELIRTPDSAFGTIDPIAGDNLAMALARFPVTDVVEMKGHTSVLSNQGVRDFLASRLGGYGTGAGLLGDTTYWLDQFRTGFNLPSGTAAGLITEQNIARAIGAYMRSQNLVETPWRRYLEGDTTAISAQAKQGALLFMRDPAEGGKSCLACHSGDSFTSERFAAIGVPQLGRGKGDGASGQEDLGRGRESGLAQDAYTFRIPSLLNVAVTGPWGHSGAYTSLEAMVAHYRRPDTAGDTYDATQLTQPGVQNVARVAQNTRGAGNKIRADRAAGILAIQNQELSDQQVADIVAFLQTLTDPCTEDASCMNQWIPDSTFGADPNGHQLNAVFSP